jgi:hypothetical protein
LSSPLDRTHGCDPQAEADATRDAQRASIAHAKVNDATAYRGRKPSFSRRQFNHVQALVAAVAMNVSDIVGLQRMAVARIEAAPAFIWTIFELHWAYFQKTCLRTGASLDKSGG